jgi:acetolactate synthase-1/2/3 large subunit
MTNYKNPKMGSEVFASALADAGITTIFTLAGGHFLPSYNAIGSQNKIKIIAARHELGAGYMASGYALASGKTGVIFSGAPGPGATNLVTPVANAHADSIALLVLTAQVDRRYLNRNILQYADNVGLLKPFCKSSLQAVSASELPNLIASALQIAGSGKPGPVHIDLPQTIQAEKIYDYNSILPSNISPSFPAEETLAEVVSLIEQSQKPAIISGHGVVRSKGTKELKNCAELMGAPVATSRSGVGSIESSNGHSVGMLGFYGTETAAEAVKNADLILVVGCSLGEQTTFGWRSDLFSRNAKIIQIDVDPKQPNLVYPVSKAVQCDAAAFLTNLQQKLTRKRSWYSKKPIPISAKNNPDFGLSAADVMQSLNKHISDDTLVSGDIGNHRLWICDQLNITCPERLLQSCEFDAMGFSLPAAVGAAVSNKNRKIVSISGDGGFIHTMGELAVIKKLDLPLAIIVFVDGALGILKHQAEEMWGKHHFVNLQEIDFKKVAQGFGIEAKRVDDHNQLDSAISWAVSASGPTFLEIKIDPNEIFPPLRSKIEQRKRDLMTQ